MSGIGVILLGIILSRLNAPEFVFPFIWWSGSLCVFVGGILLVIPEDK